MSFDSDADIVVIILRACQAAGLSKSAAQDIERTIRQTFGGLRVRIPKRHKHLTRDQRAAVLADGVTSMATMDILTKYSISRSTLYRIMKHGPY